MWFVMHRYNSESGKAVFKGIIGWDKFKFAFTMWYTPVKGKGADYGITGTGSGTIHDFMMIQGLHLSPQIFQ